jgi:hypothetical protein
MGPLYQAESKPLVNRFFDWIEKQFNSQGFLPSSPFMEGVISFV